MTNFSKAKIDQTAQLSVCICTFKRPSLARTIESILAQEDLSSFTIEILVADDDPEGSARTIVEHCAASSPVPIRYLFSGARNIAHCRNLCLSESRGSWIAFIDDDEIAADDWLKELLRARAQFEADGVKGFVQAVYPDNTPQWVRRGDPFTSDYGPTGAPVQLGATGNVLFDRRRVLETGVRFDPQLGRTGGEDLDFFERLKAQGFRLISCRTAIVYETLPESRVTKPYLMRRSRRFGHIDGRIMVARRTPLGKSWTLAKAATAVALCSCYPIMPYVNERFAWTIFGRFWYHLGVLEWALGRSSLRHE